jgi:hypothetical protein
MNVRPATRPTSLINWRGFGKAHEVLQLGCQRHRGNELHAAQRLHQRAQRPLGQGVAHGLFEPRDARRGFGDGVQVLLKADLLRRVRQLQRGQPAQVCGSPGALAAVADAVPQQQGLQAVARAAALTHRVLARAHQVAHGLVGDVGHAHGREFAGTRQAREHQRVAPGRS